MRKELARTTSSFPSETAIRSTKVMISPLVSKVNPRVTPGSAPAWILVVVQFEFPQGWYSTPTCGKLWAWQKR